MGEERWCLAICHTNYQEIDLFRVSRVGTLNTNFLHTVCMANPEQVDLLVIRMRAAKHQLSPRSFYGQLYQP